MGQRGRILTQVLGYRGWRIREAFFETAGGARVEPVAGYDVPHDCRFVLRVERRWAPRCEGCHAIVRGKPHENLPARRWQDMGWAGRAVEIEYAPIRVACRRCDSRGVELLAFADRYQRQTRRLQQHLALQAASMPIMHVAAQHGLSWATVRRAEEAALARWDATREATPLHQVGVDEKWLGRRHKLDHRFVTIVSNLETGEPIWMGPGRGQATLASWLATLSPEQKAAIRIFAMDMHAPFAAAVRADEQLTCAHLVHDPFHVMKKALDAVDEVRRRTFFRAGPELRAIGRGKRWLVLRAWERCSEEQQAQVKVLLSHNRKLARTYQIKEELRAVLSAPDRTSMALGLGRILRRTQPKANKPLRKLHDCLRAHLPAILNLGEYRPATGRVEALNNNWETLVRRARGYRDYAYLLLKLKFMTANPIREDSGVKRFLALDLPTPRLRRAA